MSIKTSEEKYREILLGKAMIPYSLGNLENLAIRLATMTEGSLDNLHLCVFCADHGITDEGVTHSNKIISAQMARAFAQGEGACGLFSRVNKVPLHVIDVGLENDLENSKVVNCKIARGTRNFLDGRAMSSEEVKKALKVGQRQTEEALNAGADCIAFGEMGVGNSTIASAIVSRMTGLDAAAVTSCGSGLQSEELAHKIAVIKSGLEIHQEKDPLEILASFGGFEIAAMVGGMLYCHQEKVPILLDGFITESAALLAKGLDPTCTDFMVATHLSAAKGSSEVFGFLNLKPLADLHLQLGEGTGAVALWPVIRLASHMLHDLKTFKELGVDDSTTELKVLGII
ncbi:MAG: nicotinate-nucleotide--dimethylbenzimidazole phosphoribosyltransferase [Sphaerochaetaceae bacterium]